MGECIEPVSTAEAHQRLIQIGHLISKYISSTPVVYNYAVGGKTVDGVVNQVSNQFLTKGPGDEYSAVHWDGEKSLFGKPFACSWTFSI